MSVFSCGPSQSVFVCMPYVRSSEPRVYDSESKAQMWLEAQRRSALDCGSTISETYDFDDGSHGFYVEKGILVSYKQTEVE